MTYQPLTPDQFQKAKSAGFSTDQIIANEKIRQQQSTPQQNLKPGVFSRIGSAIGSVAKDVVSGNIVPQNIQNIGNNIIQGAKAGINQVKEGTNQVGQSKNPLSFAEGSLNAGAGIVNTALSPLGGIMSPAVNPVINYAADKLSNIPTVQKFANSKAGNITSRVVGDVNNVNTLAGAVAGLKVGPEAGDILSNKLNSVANKTGEVISGIGSKVKEAITSTISKTVGQEAEVAQTARINEKYTNQIKSSWEKPTTINKPSYNKATEIYNNAKANGYNISDILLKDKINPTDNIENGNYSTADTATKIRNDAAKMSNEALRPSLQMADAFTPKTPVSDILNKTIADIKNSKNVTAGDIESQISKAKQEGQALSKKYPDGMSLTDMHDNKITYAQNGKYSPVGDTKVNNTAGINRAFGRTLGGLVESKAPPEIPVHEFNSELTKQYQAADYLDELNNKKAPLTVGAKVRQGIGKISGAKVGSVLGGGIPGGVAGYHIGGMIESMFENLPNPFKSQFLQNLQVINPEAFKAVSDFIGQEKAAQLTRKALPAPGQSQSPINLPASQEDLNQQAIQPSLNESKGAINSKIIPIKGRFSQLGSHKEPVTNIFGGKSNIKGRFKK